MSYRALRAKGTLGLALIKHLILRPITGRRGPNGWLARLREEDLAPTPEHAWDYLPGTERCIGCGACNILGEPGEVVSEWIASAGRRPSDAPLALEQAARLETLASPISGICPTGVDAMAVARLLRAQAEILKR